MGKTQKVQKFVISNTWRITNFSSVFNFHFDGLKFWWANIVNTNLEQKTGILGLPKKSTKSIDTPFGKVPLAHIGKRWRKPKSTKNRCLQYVGNNNLSKSKILALTEDLHQVGQYSKHKPWAKNGDFRTPKKINKVHRYSVWKGSSRTYRPKMAETKKYQKLVPPIRWK
jgi:hypothetical protein